MKTFVQKTGFVQRPGIVPGKVDVRKGKTGGFGFVQRGNGFGKGNADGDRGAEFV